MTVFYVSILGEKCRLHAEDVATIQALHNQIKKSQRELDGANRDLKAILDEIYHKNVKIGEIGVQRN